MQSQTFKTSYFFRILRGDYNPFTPDTLTINDHIIEHKRRNWYLISVDSQSYHFQYVAGVEVDKGLFGANLIIQTTGSGEIIIRGFSKKIAIAIAAHCRQYIIQNTQRSTTEALSSAITSAIGNSKNNLSVADEISKLKSLLTSGDITREEFENQKSRLLSQF